MRGNRPSDAADAALRISPLDQKLGRQVGAQAGVVGQCDGITNGGNIVEVCCQLNILHVGAQALSQGGRTLGNNGKVLVKKRRAEDILPSLTGPLNELANIDKWHRRIISFADSLANATDGALPRVRKKNSTSISFLRHKLLKPSQFENANTFTDTFPMRQG